MPRFLFVLAVTLTLQAADLKLGDQLTLEHQTEISDLLETPNMYVGKTVQVKGKVTEVCQMMGCWMMLRDDADNMVRIKVNDGEIVFPKSSPGSEAIAEGQFVSYKLTRDQAVTAAEHEAEEQGLKFDPSKIKGPTTIYQIRGTGAVVLNE